MNVFIRAMVRIFSFGERWNVLFNSAIASLNRTFHLSPHENIFTIALINIHYLYIMHWYMAMIIQWLFHNDTMIENYTRLRNKSQPLKFLYFRQVVVSAKCLFGEKSVRHVIPRPEVRCDGVRRYKIDWVSSYTSVDD